MKQSKTGPERLRLTLARKPQGSLWLGAAACFVAVALFAASANGREIDETEATGKDTFTQQAVPAGFTAAAENVDQETLVRIAAYYARGIWGDGAVGAPLALVDDRGAITTYAFPFAIAQKSFPDPKRLRDQFAGRLPSQAGPVGEEFSASAQYHEYLTSIREELRRFGTVYVSATKADHPVPRVAHELHAYFYKADAALEVAKQEYGMREPTIARIRLVPPAYEYFEIRDGRESVQIHAGTLLSRQAIQEISDRHREELAVQPPSEKGLAEHHAEVEAAWAHYTGLLAGTPAPVPVPVPGGTVRYIPYHQRMPPILWTAWCAPTAASMIFSYWDHYVPVPGVGTHVGYERIVDFWMNHPSNGANVPNLLDEIITASNYYHFANNMNGYSWSFGTVIGTAQNDWAWSNLVAEISAGRPARWQLYPPEPYPGHAIAVFGYREVPNGYGIDKYVINYTTWSENPEEWLYNHFQWYGGSGTVNHIELNTYVPGGKEIGRALFVRYPYGGEVYNAGERNRITFYARAGIKKARLDYSSDGGQTWSFVAWKAVSEGWNDYFWRFPTSPTAHARIRVEGYSSTNAYLAGDSSFEDFSLQ